MPDNFNQLSIPSTDAPLQAEAGAISDPAEPATFETQAVQEFAPIPDDDNPSPSTDTVPFDRGYDTASPNTYALPDRDQEGDNQQHNLHASGQLSSEPRVVEGRVTPGLERHSAVPDKGHADLDPGTVQAVQAIVEIHSAEMGQELQRVRSGETDDDTYVTLEAVRDMPDKDIKAQLADTVVKDFLSKGDVLAAFKTLELAGNARKEMQQQFTDADIRAWAEELQRTGRLQDAWYLTKTMVISGDDVANREHATAQDGEDPSERFKAEWKDIDADVWHEYGAQMLGLPLPERTPLDDREWLRHVMEIRNLIDWARWVPGADDRLLTALNARYKNRFEEKAALTQGGGDLKRGLLPRLFRRQ